jgi:hypothetical protein
MFARWPGLAIHEATTSVALCWPAAMFSAFAVVPAAAARSKGLRPSGLVWST